MILAHVDALEHAKGVVGQHSKRAVEGDEIRRDRLRIDAHEADRDTHSLLTGKPRLVKADDALLGLARPDQENVFLFLLV